MRIINMPIKKEREEKLKYVVIAAKYKEEWVYVRHKDRDTWEIPGGHIEKNETIHEAARRELYEESGALEFDLFDICDYGVVQDEETLEGSASFGRFLYAEIKSMGKLPDSEIADVMFGEFPKKWTYEEIQPVLFELVNNWLGGEK